MRVGIAVAAAAFALALAVPMGACAAQEGEEHAAAGEHAAEHSDEHGEPTLDGGKLGAQIVNFLLLLGILIYFGGRALSKALAARHEQLKADLAAAAELRAVAEAQLKKQEQRLTSLESEIAAMRAGIAQEAEAEKARLIQLAEERARRIQDETRFLIDQQVKQAEAELRREAALAAVEMAEQIVRRSLGADDRQRMVDSFVTDVAKPAPGGQS